MVVVVVVINVYPCVLFEIIIVVSMKIITVLIFRFHVHCIKIVG